MHIDDTSSVWAEVARVWPNEAYQDRAYLVEALFAGVRDSLPLRGDRINTIREILLNFELSFNEDLPQALELLLPVKGVI